MGLVVLCCIPFALMKVEIPDVIIAENGRIAAIKGDDGLLYRLFPKRENFVTRMWAKAYAGGKMEAVNLSKDACNREQCIFQLRDEAMLYIVYNPDLLQNACSFADILVAPRLKWVNCREDQPALILKREDFESRGSHALYVGLKSKDGLTNNAPDNREPLDDQTFQIEVSTSYGKPKRPWHRQPISYQD